MNCTPTPIRTYRQHHKVIVNEGPGVDDYDHSVVSLTQIESAMRVLWML